MAYKLADFNKGEVETIARTHKEKTLKTSSGSQVFISAMDAYKLLDGKKIG